MLVMLNKNYLLLLRLNFLLWCSISSIVVKRVGCSSNPVTKEEITGASAGRFFNFINQSRQIADHPVQSTQSSLEGNISSDVKERLMTRHEESDRNQPADSSLGELTENGLYHRRTKQFSNAYIKSNSVIQDFVASNSLSSRQTRGRYSSVSLHDLEDTPSQNLLQHRTFLRKTHFGVTEAKPRSRYESQHLESIKQEDSEVGNPVGGVLVDVLAASFTRSGQDGLIRQPRSKPGIQPTALHLKGHDNSVMEIKKDTSDKQVDPNEEFKNSPINPSVAVRGSSAVLPCNISSPVPGDSIQLVLWYKDFVPTPIYSYDVRMGLYSRPKEWSDPSLLGKRAHFSVATKPAALVLNSTSKVDEAVYRCRVDFKHHITTHARVNLTIVEPIMSVTIQDSGGTELVGAAGPFAVGSAPSLACKVVGGDPPPIVTWWKNGHMLDKSYSHQESRTTEHIDRQSARVLLSSVQLQPLTKQDLRSTYTCRGGNHDMSPVLEATVEIDMNFGPENVTVRGLSGAVSTNRPHQVMCEAKGSRPPAILTWYLDGNIVKSVSHITSLDGQVSSSTLELVLQPEDEGSILTCRAENPDLPAAVLEHSLTLQILYPPRVSVQAGSSLDLGNIKEGDDVYFDCHVNARPQASKITWTVDGRELVQNVSGGVMVVGKSLVLQRVTRRHAGSYSCSASNSQGYNTSKPVLLSVKYSPVCRVEQSDVYGVGRLERTTVTCRVEADPPVTTYRWAFNNTGEFVDIPESHYLIKSDEELGQRSDLRYSPVSDLDYGTLLCWARNSVGMQRVPCTFTVFPAGKPDTVASCRALNQTEESVVVMCEPGYSGGMNQSFLLQAWDDGSLRATDRSDTPTLEASGLRPGTRYNLRVYAENSMGRSQPFSFNAFTLTDVAERRTAIGTSKEGQPLSPVIGSIVGTSISLALLVLVAVFVARCKRHDGHDTHTNLRETSVEEPSYKSCSAIEGDARQTRRIEAESPKATTTLSDDEAETQIVPTCDLVSTSQDSILMSQSQDSNTSLIGGGRLVGGFDSAISDQSFIRHDSLGRNHLCGNFLTSPIGLGCGLSQSKASTVVTTLDGETPAHAYHQLFGKPNVSNSKWPPEDWLGDTPFIFSPNRNLESYTQESGGGAKGSYTLVSPLSSPGSVDPRRHSAYIRGIEHVQTLLDQKDLKTQQQQLLQQQQQQLLRKQKNDYQQHSLPRQFLNKKNSVEGSSRVQQAGGSNASTSPLGFSSTLNPRNFVSPNFTVSSLLGQGVTKPSSQNINSSSSDHESSV